MKKIATAILLIVAIGLFVLCGLAVEHTEDHAPVINILNENVVYAEGADTSILMQAVSATDEEDGDVSANIRIEKIIPLDNNEKVRVLYVTKDSKYNVTKKTATFGYIPSKDSQNANGQNSLKYNIVLVNNLGVENLANSYAALLSKKGHRIVNIGLSTDVPVPTTTIYVTTEGLGQELLEIFPNAKIVVGNIANRVNVNSNSADTFIVLGYQHSIVPEI